MYNKIAGAEARGCGECERREGSNARTSRARDGGGRERKVSGTRMCMGGVG